MANSDVWINGFHLGHRPYGYVSFSYELNGHLNFRADNVLAVRADTSQQPASRWYTGAGIYRHVRLVTTDPIHIGQWGEFIHTPQVSAKEATVALEITVTNASAAPNNLIKVITILVAPNGKTVGQTESLTLATNNASMIVRQEIPVKNPALWNLDHPQLYRAVTMIRDGNEIRDAHKQYLSASANIISRPKRVFGSTEKISKSKAPACMRMVARLARQFRWVFGKSA